MLEKELIQMRGFKNLSKNGKVIGFTVLVRSIYYRGVQLSTLRPATVIVDGEKFEGDKITWTIGGKTYTQTGMAELGNTHWQLSEPAILTVTKPGGLVLGKHEVEVAFGYSQSYMPPAMEGRERSGKRTMVLVA